MAIAKLVFDPRVNVAAAGTFDAHVLALDAAGAATTAPVGPTTHTDDAGIATVSYNAGVLTITGVAIGTTRVWIVDAGGTVSNKIIVSVHNAALGPSAHSAVGHHGGK